jgi:hypothetical protein
LKDKSNKPFAFARLPHPTGRSTTCPNSACPALCLPVAPYRSLLEGKSAATQREIDRQGDDMDRDYPIENNLLTHFPAGEKDAGKPSPRLCTTG